MQEDGKPYRAGPRKRGARRKKAVNVTVDADLLVEAKIAGLNLSGLLERTLSEELKERRWQKWRDDNRTAIEKSNAQLERDGLWYEPAWLRK